MYSLQRHTHAEFLVKYFLIHLILHQNSFKELGKLQHYKPKTIINVLFGVQIFYFLFTNIHIQHSINVFTMINDKDTHLCFK